MTQRTSQIQGVIQTMRGEDLQVSQTLRQRLLGALFLHFLRSPLMVDWACEISSINQFLTLHSSTALTPSFHFQPHIFLCFFLFERPCVYEAHSIPPPPFFITSTATDELKKSRPINVAARFNWLVVYTLLQNPQVGFNFCCVHV